MAESDIMTFENVYSVLQDYSDEFVRLLMNKMESDDAVASGDLTDSIRTEIRTTADTYKVVLTSEDYMRFVEEGRRAASKFPPVDAIEKWIEDKGILPHPSSSGKLPTTKQLAFLIGRAIANNGTMKRHGWQGGHYIANSVEELNVKYIPLLNDALEKDWGNAQIRILKKIGKMVKI